MILYNNVEEVIEMAKLKNKEKLLLLNELLVAVEIDKRLMIEDNFFKLKRAEQMSYISGITNKLSEVEDLNNQLNLLLEYAPDLSSKVYLSEIIELEKPEFKTNNLILAPTGSGKTTLIMDKLIKKKVHTVLLLVSNTTLKDQLAPNDDDLRKELSNRMFTSDNKNTFGDALFNIYVMTYAEFGSKIYVNDSFMTDIEQIFCDEIHSLPEYIKYGGDSNGGLIHAQRILFNKHDGKQIFYFTATNDNLITMEKEYPGTLACVSTFDYMDYPDIMRFVPRSMREITHIEQIRQYLKDRKPGFKFYNYKGMAFSKTIKSLKSIEEIVIEEGFNPLVLWSYNNKDNPLSEDQHKAREELLKTNKIPEPYDFIIFNSAFQEGWNLKDESVKLAIINTTNNTEYTQALGRLRRDVDLLIYRTNNMNLSIDEPIDEYLNKPLTSEDKEVLCNKLSIIGHDGKIVRWTNLKKILTNANYNIADSTKRVNGKTTRVTTITKK